MKAFVATGMIGSFAFDAKGKLLHYVLFRQDPAHIATRVAQARKGEIIPEEEELVKDLIRSGYDEIVWEKKVDFPGVECLYEPENPGKDALQKGFRRLALDLRFVQNDAELNKMLAEVNVLLTKGQLRKERKDAILMRAISVVDELDRTANTLSEMLREWYGLYFPEAERLIRDHAQLAKVIHEEGERDKISDPKVAKYAGMTAGMPFSSDDLAAVQEYAKSVAGIHALHDSLTSYIKKTSKAYMPNLTAVAGPLIACRLLVLAGGLERLAKLPSSTMQLLGAEKALFRHLKSSKDKPPKFGVIFAHPLIMGAQKNEKGRMARLLAAKLVMAARADFYTGKDMSEKLLADLGKKTAYTVSHPHAPQASEEAEVSTPSSVPERRMGRVQTRPFKGYGPSSRGQSRFPDRRMDKSRDSPFQRHEPSGSGQRDDRPFRRYGPPSSGAGSSRFSARPVSQGAARPYERREPFRGGSRPRTPGKSFGPDKRKPKYKPQRKRHN
jgi:nucleolar protein 56